jgi:hypothetical protein
MIPSTLKTIFIDSELDDSSVLLDAQHPYREKDLLLTNHFDDVEDDVHDQVSEKKIYLHEFSSFLSMRTCCYACIYVMQNS